MCDLAEQAQLSRSGLTRLVDRLEREQLIERCSCEHDARGSFACLTESGRERLREARSTHLAVVREQFFSRFSEPELAALADMCQRVAPCTGVDAPGC
jgi:DNA-binding MarR family transcriptional regulator